MEKNIYKPKIKKRKKINKKYRCELCERIVIKHKYIKIRKNYPFGKKSKPLIYKEHRLDGGCLIELKREKNEFRSHTN